MSKLWSIIKYEYKKHVLNKRFLFSLLSLPGAVIAMGIVAVVIATLSIDTTPVGYIDHSGILDDATPPEIEGGIFNMDVDFRPYQSEDQARDDLQAGDIQAYYIIPEDYPEPLDVELIYLEEPASEIQGEFTAFLRQNLPLFENLDPAIQERLKEGSQVTIAAFDGSRELNEDQWFMIFTPFVAGIMFFIVVMTSGGYLLQAVVEEKENRTMEILITSVTHSQLMSGKIIGNIGVGLTQLIIWLIFVWVGLIVGGLFFPVLQDFSIPANYIVVMLLVLLPSFVMVAAIMAAIGSTMTEMKEAQQVSSLFSLPIMIPYYLATTIMENPNATLAMILSYFPVTAPVTLLMRMAFTVVPIWQIASIIGVLVIFAALAIWFAGRAFKLGMLRYGKKLSFKEIFRNKVEK